MLDHDVERIMENVLNNYKNIYSIKDPDPFALAVFKENYEEPNPEFLKKVAKYRSDIKKYTHDIYTSLIMSLPNEDKLPSLYKCRLKQEVNELLEAYAGLRRSFNEQMLYNFLAYGLKNFSGDLPSEEVLMKMDYRNGKRRSYKRNMIRHVVDSEIGRGQIFALSRVKSLKSIFEKTAKGKRITDFLGLKFIFDIEGMKERELLDRGHELLEMYGDVGFVPFSKTSVPLYGCESYVFYAQDMDNQYILVYLPSHLRHLVRDEFRNMKNTELLSMNNTMVYAYITGKDIKEGKKRVKELQEIAEKRKPLDELLTPEVRTKEIKVPIWEDFFRVGMYRSFVDQEVYKEVMMKFLNMGEDALDLSSFGIRDYVGDNRKSNGYTAVHINMGLSSETESYDLGGLNIVPVIPTLEVQATTLAHHINNEVGSASHDGNYKQKQIIDYYAKLFFRSCKSCGIIMNKTRERKILNSVESVFKSILKDISGSKYETFFFPN